MTGGADIELDIDSDIDGDIDSDSDSHAAAGVELSPGSRCVTMSLSGPEPR